MQNTLYKAWVKVFPKQVWNELKLPMCLSQDKTTITKHQKHAKVSYKYKAQFESFPQ